MRSRAWATPVLVLLAATALTACDDAGGLRICTPGTSRSCLCPGGDRSFSRCSADGERYGPCPCDRLVDAGQGGEGGGLSVGQWPPRNPYPDADEIEAELTTLAAEHPLLAEVVDYGDSFEKGQGGEAAGHDLLALRISNRLVVAPKPVLLLVAGTHGDEVVSAELALRWARWLLGRYDVDADPTWLVDEHELWLVPAVNPDSLGVQRNNANGVDLNRNHDFHWIAGATHGDGPASEPEVRFLQQLVGERFVDQRGPADDDEAPPETTGLFVSLHAPYGKVAWPWAWSELPAPNATDLGALAALVAGPLGYDVGQSAEVIYPMAGSATDWVYGTLGVPALLVETGPSKAPSWAELESVIWPAHRQALVRAAAAAREPYRLAWGPVVTVAPPVRDEGDEVVRFRATLALGHAGDGVVAGGELTFDQPPWAGAAAARPLTAVDGSFDGSEEDAELSLSFADLDELGAGRHTVFVRGWSEDGAYGAPAAIFFDVGMP